MLPDCNSGKIIEIVSDKSDLFEYMNLYWPSLNSPNEKFWTHEYNKHGYCYAQRYNKMKPADFFTFVVNYFKVRKLESIFINAGIFKQTVSSRVSSNVYNAKKTEKVINFDHKDLIALVQKVLPGTFMDFTCSKKIDGVQYLEEIRFYLDLNLRPMAPKRFSSTCKKDTPISVSYI